MSGMGRVDVTTLRSLIEYLYRDTGRAVNTDAVANALHIGNDTVDRYLRKLTRAFLFHHVERYDIARRRMMRTKGRFYASDLGLRRVMCPDDGDIYRTLRSAVFQELLNRGYTVVHGAHRCGDVDFVAFRTDSTEFYQVCPATDEGRIGILSAIRSDHRKAVLTPDIFGTGDRNGITVVNVIDWLLAD